MRVGKVRNMQLVLNNWFIVLIVLFAAAGMAVKVVIVFGAVLWHELAHAAMAISLGYRVREMELLPFGGVARIDRLGEASSKSEILIAAAGPAASLLLAAAIYILGNLPGQLGETLQFFYDTNIMLALFNLIPALPLDGGRIFRALLAQQYGYAKATAVAAGASKFISLGLILKVVYDYWLFHVLNLSLVVAAVFLYVASKADLKISGYRTMRVMAGKKTDLLSRGVMPTAHYTVLLHSQVGDVVKLFEPERYHVLLVLNEQCEVCGWVTESQIWESLSVHGLNAKMADFL